MSRTFIVIFVIVVSMIYTEIRISINNKPIWEFNSSSYVVSKYLNADFEVLEANQKALLCDLYDEDGLSAECSINNN